MKSRGKNQILAFEYIMFEFERHVFFFFFPICYVSASNNFEKFYLVDSFFFFSFFKDNSPHFTDCVCSAFMHTDD